MKNVIILILVVVIAYLGVTLYSNQNNNKKIENKKTEDLRADTSKNTAKLIISSFELAYNTAYMKAGNKPTLEMVSQEFNLESTESKFENGILKIKSDFGAECETKKEDQGIYLYCILPNEKTSFKSKTVEIIP